MDNDLDDLFGEIHGYVDPKCCNASENNKNDNQIILNYPILAHLDEKDACNNDRKFFVNLHLDGSWSFTFSNGESLTESQKQSYCNEISGAQSKLYNERKWFLNGKGLGVWDNFGQKVNKSITVDSNTKYFNNGNFNDFGEKTCKILPSADLK